MMSGFTGSRIPPIKSIQYISGAVAGGSLTKDVTITAVVVANTVVVSLGRTVPSGSAITSQAIEQTRWNVESTTTVRLKKYQ